jgi:hypothetical protein
MFAWWTSLMDWWRGRKLPPSVIFAPVEIPAANTPHIDAADDVVLDADAPVNNGKRTVPWAGGTRGKYDTATGRLRRDLVESADVILDRFGTLRVRSGDRERAFHDVPLLEELLGNDFMLYDPDLIARAQGGDKYSHFAPSEGEELMNAAWPMDCGVIAYHDRSEEDDLVPHVSMQWIRTVEPQDVRGRVRLVVPRMARVVTGCFGDNGSWFTDEHIVGMVNHRWVSVDAGVVRKREASITWTGRRFTQTTYHDDWLNRVITIAAERAFSARYSWHVAFGSDVPGGPRLLVPTNPEGCLKLFRDRDAVGERRKALKHWVEHYYRDTQEAGTTYVRDFLRGHTLFRWNEIECELLVSEFDLEKNSLFAMEAAEWRARRKHNRVRVRLKRGVGR